MVHGKSAIETKIASTAAIAIPTSSSSGTVGMPATGTGVGLSESPESAISERTRRVLASFGSPAANASMLPSAISPAAILSRSSSNVTSSITTSSTALSSDYATMILTGNSICDLLVTIVQPPPAMSPTPTTPSATVGNNSSTLLANATRPGRSGSSAASQTSEGRYCRWHVHLTTFSSLPGTMTGEEFAFIIEQCIAAVARTASSKASSTTSSGSVSRPFVPSARFDAAAAVSARRTNTLPSSSLPNDVSPLS
jgi:hypothetical protein